MTAWLRVRGGRLGSLELFYVHDDNASDSASYRSKLPLAGIAAFLSHAWLFSKISANGA